MITLGKYKKIKLALMLSALMDNLTRSDKIFKYGLGIQKDTTQKSQLTLFVNYSNARNRNFVTFLKQKTVLGVH